MPVTAKLSRAIYDKLGDDVADGLVNWFNEVDLTYPTELRELNDLNFARFDAKVGERMAELRAGIEATLRGEMDTRFAALRSDMDARFAALRSDMDTRFGVLRSDLDTRAFRSDMDARFARVDQRFEAVLDQIRDTKTSMIKWMFTFWVGTALIILGSRLAQ